MNYRAQNIPEENNYPKAIAIASGIMAFLLVISFFIVIGSFEPAEDAGMGGMVVNYGTSKEGMGDDYTSIEEPSADPNANGKAPDKVTPEDKVTPVTSSENSDKAIQTQNTDDAIAVNTKPTKATTNAPTPVTEDKPSKPVINQNALYKGKKNTGQGKGDGTGSTPGNQGDPDGDPNASNYGEGGSGFGETPIDLRKFTDLVLPQDDGQKTGKVAVRIKVTRSGQVLDATPGVKGTTLNDRELWQKCKDAVMKARVTQSESGPEVQLKIVIFYFKVK